MATALAFVDFSDATITVVRMAREIALGVETTALLVRGRSSRGSPVRKMVSELKRIKPALIVMGTHQHGRLVQAMFGSASTRVIHKASCPILLIPSQNPSVGWITKRKAGSLVRPNRQR